MSRSRFHRVACAALALGALAFAGCESTGLSTREVRGRDYATYAYAMYDPSSQAASRPAAGSSINDPSALTDSPATAEPAKPIAAPLRIAVAQLGEVAPPAEMLKQLRKQSATFASVQPVSGVLNTDPSDAAAHAQDYSSQKDAKEHAERMRRYARDLGADYLFLFGGTIDKATTDSPIKLANVTIIGAFVVPGEVIQADARATGSLVDVKTGRAVLAVSADAHDRRRASTVARQGDEIKMLESIRDEIVSKLAEELTNQVKTQAQTARG